MGFNQTARILDDQISIVKPRLRCDGSSGTAGRLLLRNLAGDELQFGANFLQDAGQVQPHARQVDHDHGADQDEHQGILDHILAGFISEELFNLRLHFIFF